MIQSITRLAVRRARRIVAATAFAAAFGALLPSGYAGGDSAANGARTAEPPAATPAPRPSPPPSTVRLTPREEQQQAIRADIAPPPGAERVVLRRTEWWGPEGFEATTAHLVIFTRRADGWQAWKTVPLRWPGWASDAELSAGATAPGERPSLLITYATGGTGGGARIDVVRWAAAAFQTVSSPEETWFRTDDLDGDGALELIGASVLPGALDWPFNAARWYWTTIYAVRRDRIVDTSSAHRGYYAARLATLTEGLARLDAGKADTWEQTEAGYFRMVRAEEAYRIRRLLAGRAPFGDGSGGPVGGPITTGDR